MKSTSITIALILMMIVAGGLLMRTVWGAVFASADDEEISDGMARMVGTAVFPAHPEVGRGSVPGTVPVRLRIPAIGVDAAVQGVGISVHGTMAVPKSYADAGWYRYGPVPGEPGTAIMAGHLNNGFALPGVFMRLNHLKQGDAIYVTDARGQDYHFKVAGVKTVRYTSALTEEVSSTASESRLALVTCDGAWIASERSYAERFIVFAILVPEE